MAECRGTVVATVQALQMGCLVGASAEASPAVATAVPQVAGLVHWELEWMARRPVATRAATAVVVWARGALAVE